MNIKKETLEEHLFSSDEFSAVSHIKSTQAIKTEASDLNIDEFTNLETVICNQEAPDFKDAKIAIQEHKLEEISDPLVFEDSDPYQKHLDKCLNVKYENNFEDLGLHYDTQEEKIPLVMVAKTRCKIKRIFKCGDCTRSFKHRGSLTVHSRVKHDKESHRFCCYHCSYTTKRKHDLAKHLEGKHQCKIDFKHRTSQIYYCTKCNRGFKTKVGLKTHLKVEHDRNAQVFYCHFCFYNSKRKDHFADHLKRKHCERYGKLGSSFDRVLNYEHERIRSDNMYVDVSSLKFEGVSRNDGEKRLESAKLLRCKLCYCGYKSTGALALHVRIRHDKKAEELFCAHCKYTIKRKDHLAEHLRRKHSGGIKF